MDLMPWTPNFPMLITIELIEACGEPTDTPYLYAFGYEEFWGIHAWKEPHMPNWEVYVTEGSEGVVKFHVPNKGEYQDYGFNINTAAFGVARRIPNFDNLTRGKIWEQKRHPVYDRIRQRRIFYGMDHLYENPWEDGSK